MNNKEMALINKRDFVELEVMTILTLDLMNDVINEKKEVIKKEKIGEMVNSAKHAIVSLMLNNGIELSNVHDTIEGLKEEMFHEDNK